jgi:hypothetical protein
VILAFVCGTAADPQDIGAQQQRLRDVGAFVLDTNAAAVESAARLLAATHIVAPPTAATSGGGQ